MGTGTHRNGYRYLLRILPPVVNYTIVKEEIKILIADNDPLFIKGFKLLLKFEDSIEIVGSACDGTEAMILIKDKKPDIAVLDIEMPNKDGLSLLRDLNEDSFSGRVIFLSVHSDSQSFNKAISLKACGYVLKENYESEIVEAILNVSAGKTYYSPQLKGFLRNQN